MLQFTVILCVFCISAIAAIRIGRLTGSRWTLGFVIGSGIILFLNFPKAFPSLLNTAIYQAAMTNNADAVMLGVAGIVSVVPCLPRLAGTRTRYLVVAFLAVSLVRSAILPAAFCYFNRDELSALPARIDSDGVNIQTTGYTCGPAATATVLNALGYDVTEGEIALETGCNAYSGTRSLDLVKYINERYGENLHAEYVYIDRIDSLKGMDGYFIAEVKAGTFTDHFVAIMAFTGETVTIADPSFGRYESRISAFTKNWRNKVIVVQRVES